MAMVMLLSLVPSSGFALNNRDGSAYTEGVEFDYGTANISNPGKLTVDTSATTETIRLAEARYSFKNGNKVVFATPSGIPECNGSFATTVYGAEQAVAPTVQIKIYGISSPNEVAGIDFTADNISGASWQLSTTTGTQGSTPWVNFVWTLQAGCLGNCQVSGGPDTDITYDISFNYNGKTYHEYAFAHAEYIAHPNGMNYYMRTMNITSTNGRQSTLTMLMGAQMKHGWAGDENKTRGMLNGAYSSSSGGAVAGMGSEGPITSDAFIMQTNDANESIVYADYQGTRNYNNACLWNNTFGTAATDGNRPLTTVWIDKAVDHLGEGTSGSKTNGLNMRLIVKAGESSNFVMGVMDSVVLRNNNLAGYGRGSSTSDKNFHAEYYNNNETVTEGGTWGSADFASYTVNWNSNGNQYAAVNARGQANEQGTGAYHLNNDVAANGHKGYIRIRLNGDGPNATQSTSSDCWALGWQYLANFSNGWGSDWNGGNRGLSSNNISVRFRVYDTTVLRQVLNAIYAGEGNTISVTFGGQYGSSQTSRQRTLTADKGANPQSFMYSYGWDNYLTAFKNARKVLAAFDVTPQTYSYTGYQAMTAGVEQTKVDQVTEALIVAYNNLVYQNKGRIVVHHYLEGTTTPVAPDEVFIGLDDNGTPVKEGRGTPTQDITNGAKFTLRALTRLKGYEVVGANSVNGSVELAYNGTTYGVTTLKNEADATIGITGSDGSTEYVFYYAPADQTLKIFTNNGISEQTMIMQPTKTGMVPDFAQAKTKYDAKEHYNYAGMFESADLSGSAINESTWTMPNEDANLYVKWTAKPIKVHVTAYDNNGEPVAITGNEYSAPVTPEAVDGVLQNVEFNRVAEPTVEAGNTFIDFYSDAACTQAIEWPIVASYNPEEGQYAIVEGTTENTVEIYAKYVNLNNKIFFEPKNGTMPEGYESGEMNFATGSPVTYPVPTREGYIFTGWVDENDRPITAANAAGAYTGAWTSVDGNGVLSPVEGGTITMSTSKGFTAYATWQPLAITVRYRLNIPASEVSSMNSKEDAQHGYYEATVYSDQIATEEDAPANPRRFGYAFNYWSYDNKKFSFDGRSKYPVLPAGEDTFEITAVWKSANDVAFAELTSYIKYAGSECIADTQHADLGIETKDAAPGDTVSIKLVVQGKFYSGSQSYIFGYNKNFYEEIAGVDVFDINENNAYVDSIKAEVNTVETFNSQVQNVLTYTDPVTGESGAANVKYVQLVIDPNVRAMDSYHTASMEDDTYLVEIRLKIKDTAQPGQQGSVWIATETLRSADFLMGDTFLSYTSNLQPLTNVETDRVKFDTDTVCSTVKIADVPDPEYNITLQLPTVDGEVKGVFADGTTAAKTYTGRNGQEILEPYTAADGTAAYGFPTPTREGYHLVGWYLVNADSSLDMTNEWTEGYYATVDADKGLNQADATYEAVWEANTYSLTFYQEDKETLRGVVEATYDQVGVTPARYNSGQVVEVLGYVEYNAEPIEANLIDFTTYRVTGHAEFYALVKPTQKTPVINAVLPGADGNTTLGSITLSKEIQTALGLELRVGDTLEIVETVPETPAEGVQYITAADVQALMAGTFTYVDGEGTTVTVPAGIADSADRKNFEINTANLPATLVIAVAAGDNTVNVYFQGGMVTETFSTGYVSNAYGSELYEVSYVSGTYEGTLTAQSGVEYVDGFDEDGEEITIEVPVTTWTVTGRYGTAFDFDAAAAGIVPPTGYTFRNWNTSSDTFVGGTYRALYTSVNATVHFLNADNATDVQSGSKRYSDGNYTRANLNAYMRNVTAPEGYTVDGWQVATKTGDTFTAASEELYLADGVYINTVWDNVVTDEDGAYHIYFVPHLKASDYNVIYYTIKNGAQTEEKSLGTKVTYGNTYTLAAAPSTTGYTFSGWYADADCTSAVTAPGTEVTLNSTAPKWYGKYTANEYTVTFDANGGESTTTAQVAFDSDITAPETNPTKVGHTFVGWAKTSTATAALTTLGKLTTEGTTFYAVWEKANYTVTYMNGDETVDVVTVTYGDAIPAHDGVEKTGFTFVGWTPALPETMPAENLVVNAEFEANTFTITYKVDGETYETFDVVYGEEVDTPEDPEKEGYTFAGWTPEVPATMPAENIEVEAVFTKESYTINYNIGEATGAAPAAATANYGDVITLPEVDFEGYTLEGWYIGSTKIGDKGATWTVTDLGDNGAAVEVTANWVINQYTITFAEEDGTVISTITKDYKAAIAESEYADITPAEKTGYTFTGWTVPAEMPAYNQTIKAAYTKNSYTLTFKTEDGATELGNISAFYGDTIADTDYAHITAPAKEGYTFAGWAPEVPTTMPAEDVTVNAQYTINSYTVTYQTRVTEDGVYEVLTTQEYDYNAAITAATAPDMDGYTFSGWDNVPATMPARDIVVSGTYTINTYAVTYVVDGVTYDTKAANYNTALNTVLPEQPAKAGYNFVKWNYTLDGEAYTAATMPAGNLTATAEFAKHSYTLNFNYNGGTKPLEAPATLAVEFDEAINLPSTDILYTGYTFTGWYATAEDAANGTNRLGGDANVWNVPAQASDGDVITIYAGYSQNEYVLAFAVEAGATEVANINYNYGDEITAAEAPTTAAAGRDFLGWYEDAECTQAFAWGPLPDLGTAGATKTLYAKFVDHVYENGVVFVQPDTQDAGYHGEPTFADNTPYEKASGEPWAITATNGQALAEYPTDAPAVANYTFDYWTYDGQKYAVVADAANNVIALADFVMPSVAEDEVVYFVPHYTRVDVTLEVETTSSAAIVDKDETESEAITGFIYNVGEKQKKADVNSQLEVTGDGEIVIVPSKANVCGTGSKVQLIDLATNEPIETYYIIVFGDVNGTASVNSADAAIILEQTKISDAADRTWGLAESTAMLTADQQAIIICNNRAADTDADNDVDNIDYDNIQGYILGYVDYEFTEVVIAEGTPEEVTKKRYMAI